MNWPDDFVNKIICGDCLEVMKEIPDKSIDLVLTDPPYSLSSASSRRSANKPMGWGDINNASIWFSLWYQECWRILKDSGSFWSFCSWQSFPVVHCATSRIAGMYITSVLIWDKQWPSVGSTKGLRKYYEMIILARKPDFSIIDRKIGDIWQCRWTSFKPSGHPSEKPLELTNKIISISNLPKEAIVFDPFLGSGTTAVACKNLNRNFIGIEISPAYCKIAEERLAQGVL